MKQHPILFSTAMVQAILAGRKTQTRRIMKPQVEPCNHKAFTYAPWKDDPTKFVESFSDKGYWYCELCGNGTGNSNEFKGIKFPYGEVGDVLYVRESFRVNSWCPDDVELSFRYEADGFVSPSIYFEDDEVFNRYWEQSCNDLADAGYEIDPDENYSDYKYDALRLRPSIHMPRAACRLYLQITDIRVERLNEISEEDAKAEGVKTHHTKLGITYYDYTTGYFNGLLDAKESFQTLWQSINGPDSWQANPFVWVISFKKIDKP